MKRLTTLTGKNLPRLAVAKPGWPEPTLEQLMVIDAHLNSGVESETVREIRQTIENDKLARDLAYEAYLANIDPLTGESTITPKAIEDFTRVCDQTGLSEKLPVVT